MKIPMKKEIIEDRIIDIIIIERCEIDRFGRILFIAAALPVLDFPKEYRAIKLRDIIIVFVAPTRKRKERESCFVISEAKKADWPEPMPGRKEDIGEAREIAIEDFISCFLSINIFFKGMIVCFGIDVLFFKERIKADVPNRPVRRGNSGWFIGRFSVKKPRKPDKEKTIKERIGDFSLSMK